MRTSLHGQRSGRCCVLHRPSGGDSGGTQESVFPQIGLHVLLRLRCLILGSVFTSFLLVLSVAGAEGPAVLAGPPAQAVPVQQRIEPEPFLDRLSALEERVEREAEKVREEARSQVSQVVSLMECFLALLAIVGGLVAFIGYSDRKAVKAQADRVLEEAEKAKAEAGTKLVEVQAWEQKAKLASAATDAARISLEQAAKDAGDSAVQAKEAVKHLQAARESLGEAWGDIDRAFGNLPRIKPRLVGDPPLADRHTISIFEDCDVTLLVCDQLRIPADARKSAAHFVKLAGFWREVRNFSRALSRLERAKELLPSNSTIPREMAWARAEWAVIQPEGPPSASDRLSAAVRHVEEAERLEGGQPDIQTVFARAWILDAQGEFDGAAAVLRQAIELDRFQAQEQGRITNGRLSYSLACTLARAGKFEEAVAAFQFVRDRTEYREMAKREPDFQKLRESSPWAEEFSRMLADVDRANAQGTRDQPTGG